MPDATLPVNGSCLCGAVRFRVSGPFLSVGYCHCTHCQKRTGTGWSTNGRVAQGDFELLSGLAELRAWAPATGVPKLFCGECGAHLFSGDPLNDEEVAIRIGAFDGPVEVEPSFHMFVRSAPDWAPVPDDGLVRYEMLRPS